MKRNNTTLAKVQNLFLLIVAALSLQKAAAQDIQFSQFYAVPQYLNPAFTGGFHYKKVAFQQRVQWPGLDARYLTSLVAFETYSPKYRSAFGVMALVDLQGPSRISSNEIQFQYAYELPVTTKITFRPALQLGLVSRNINYSRLDFPDQYNDKQYLGATAEVFSNDRIFYPDVSSGFLINSEKFWVGVSAHHMNVPNISVYELSRLPMKLAVAGGYQIVFKNLGGMYSTDRLTLIPTFHYKSQGRSDQFDLGMYLNYELLVVGAWYRGIPVKKYSRELHNNESLALLVGMKVENFRVGYSYDFIISRLIPARPVGAHELSLSYTFKDNKIKRLKKRLPCPHF